jgi:hypothetical protein
MKSVENVAANNAGEAGFDDGDDHDAVDTLLYTIQQGDEMRVSHTEVVRGASVPWSEGSRIGDIR